MKDSLSLSAGSAAAGAVHRTAEPDGGRWAWWLGLLAVGIGLSAVAFVLGSYQTDVYRKMLLWITLALSYNFLFGIAGQVAFSHFAFYGVGAYAIVILVFQVGLPLPLAIVVGVLLCVVLALVGAIPATRL